MEEGDRVQTDLSSLPKYFEVFICRILEHNNYLH